MNTSTLSANLQIADRENNILKVADGKAYVDGTARNINYGDGTVASTLTEHTNKLNNLDSLVESASKTAHIEGGQTDTFETLVSNLADGGSKVTGNVRLGNQNSIVVRNGGLEANITIDVDTASNKLIVTIGNQTITKQLPGVELFESAEYNDENEELIITFRTGNTLVIPIHGIIHTWNTVNPETSPIVLTKDVVTGGVDTLSGNIKLRSTNNLIGIENGRLFVSEQVIDNKVNAETTRATDAETAIRTSIENLTTNVNSQFDNVSDRITEVSDNLATEVTNRTNKDTELDGKITNVTNTIANEKQRAETAEEALDTKIDTLETNMISRINHDIEDVQHLISDETTRATNAETAINSRIEEVSSSISESSEQSLEQAKAYTDTKVLAEKTARETKETQIENSITTAVRNASDDATAKADAAKADANTYTDSKVAAEQARAEAAEQALSTQLSNKIESVEIVKNTQSDLQYILKVDGQDAGEINIPKDQFLRSVTYDPSTKQMTFVFETTQGTSTTVVDMSGLVDTYTNGRGIDLNGNVFSAKIDASSESYLTLTEGGIKLFGIDSALAQKANVTDINTINEKINTINGNEAVEGSIKNALKQAKDYTDEKVSVKANAADVYTKTEIDNKGYLTQHQDISNLATKASLQETDDKATQNANNIAALTSEVNGMKFIAGETDTVRMQKVQQNNETTLTSDVKIKTIPGVEDINIIKKDANGIYATVSLTYDTPTNTLTFNDGNGNKEIKLTGASLVEGADYDNVNKLIILHIKNGDVSSDVTIPVGDLVDTWTVQQPLNSPVILTKTSDQNGDVLSANIAISNNSKNLLTVDEGMLFADGDSNAHFALWGSTEMSVQGALNLIKGKLDIIDTISGDVADFADELNALQIQVNLNTQNITNVQRDINNLETRVERIEQVIDGLGDINSRLDAIEAALADLIDFGKYNI